MCESVEPTDYSITLVDSTATMVLQPESIASTRVITRSGRSVMQWLVHWENFDVTAATWEDKDQLLNSFPTLNLEDKVSTNGEGNVMTNTEEVHYSKMDIEQILMEAQHRESIHVIEEKASANIGLCFLQLIFPCYIDNNEDNLWEANCREKNEEIATRGMKFLNRLWTREEREITIFSHNSFLHQTFGVFGHNLHPSVKSEICTQYCRYPRVEDKLPVTRRTSLRKGLESMYSLAQKSIQLKPMASAHKLMGLIIEILGENTEVVLAECLKGFGPW
ncbi:hypothetical protein F3Y22_tig00110777pilonHSYRG00115 [Hibiscus syriacus]|uniref:Chromo domain-containing protein n=1 Tax=Hibiscus syriacus TaxID=106335 RepID=A0A6A2ZRU7_HIBSY|nr:hypothetical protein F3Y22_tig00110777pilonHSYRG00115 [Hibiscus syriacus]